MKEVKGAEDRVMIGKRALDNIALEGGEGSIYAVESGGISIVCFKPCISSRRGVAGSPSIVHSMSLNEKFKFMEARVGWVR